MESALTGNAGVYFVAARLSAMGLQCAPTFGNVPSVDILVSSRDGSASVGLQVKTTSYGTRTRGRRAAKKPDHYEWDIGSKSAKLNGRNLFFALVNLRGFQELPEVFIVPSKVIADYFTNHKLSRARFHPRIELLAPYKDNWGILGLKRIEAPEAVGGTNPFPGEPQANAEIEEAKLLAEARRGREEFKHIFLTDEQINTAKRWGRE